MSTVDKHDSLVNYLDRFIDDTLSRCTRCGKCFEACPMTRYAEGLTEADPKIVVNGVLDWLQNKPGNTESVSWLKVCTQSSRCTEACPEGIDAMKMVRIAQMSALGSFGAPAQMKSREEPHFFRKINAFSQTQMTEEEMEQWQR